MPVARRRICMDAPTTPDVLATKPDPVPSTDSVSPAASAVPAAAHVGRARAPSRSDRPHACADRVDDRSGERCERLDLFSRPRAASRHAWRLDSAENSGHRCFNARRHGAHRRGFDRPKFDRIAKVERTGILRHFLQPSESFSLPRKRFHPARHLRHRDARNSQFDP